MSQSKFVRNTMATLRGLGFPQPCNTTTSISCFSLPVHFVSPSSSIQGTSIRASESTVSTLTSSNISCSTSSHISLYRSHSLTGSSSSVCHYPQESSSRRRRWTYTLDPRGTVVSTSSKKQKHYSTRRKSSVTPAQKAWLTEMEALLKVCRMHLSDMEVLIFHSTGYLHIYQDTSYSTNVTSSSSDYYYYHVSSSSFIP